MPQRRPLGGRRNDNEFVPRWEFEQLKAELRGEIQRSERQIPVWINIEPDPLGGPDGTGGYTWRFRGAADKALAADVIETDGAAPGSSPTPVMTGGITMLFIKWTPIVNADEVTYEVHLSTTTGFTPSAATLLTDTQGFMVTTRTLPDGTPLAQGTTYYAKIIARDADSAAAASAQDDAVLAQVTEPDIATDAIIARHILAEEIQAGHLEAAMVLVNTLIAGAGAATTRIEIGVAQDEEDSFIGIRSFDSEGIDTLRVDAETGKLYVRGEIDWGTASRLDEDDVMLIKEQAIGFQTPSIRQRSAGGVYNAGGLSGSISRTFGSPSLAGNTLILHIFQWREGTTTPGAISDPAGYTLIENRTGSGTFGSVGANYRSRQQVWVRENAPATSSISRTPSSDATHATMDFVEVRGTLASLSVDSAAEDSEVGESVDHETHVGPTATLAQTDSLAISFHSVFVHENDVSLDSNGNIYWHHEPAMDTTGTEYGFSITPNNRVTVPSIGTCTMYEVTAATTALEHGMHWSATPAFSDEFGYESYIMVLKAAVAAVTTPEQTWVKVYGKFVNGSSNDATALHTIGEDGVEMSLVGGPANARYQLFTFTATHNVASLGAHAGTSTAMAVTGAAVGDLVIGVQVLDATDVRPLLLHPEPTVTVADQVQMVIFNTDSGVRDAASTTYRFFLLRPL